MALDSEFIKKVKEANDITDIVGKYIKLSRSSSNSPWYIGKCPFHEETDGSFKVNSSTQSWFCYGCGKGDKSTDNKGSDVIAFIQEIEELPWKDALKFLANKANIPFQDTPVDPTIEHFKKVSTDNNRRYFNNLWDDKNQFAVSALNYLRGRGLTDSTIRNFRLGLVPSDELVNRNDIQDIANKVAIPIIEVSTNPKPLTLGMSYRMPIENPPKPKYKNDCTTTAFQKKDLLYGLNFAYPNIRKQREGIIVECFFGTMALHQEGITNVVSTMGTMISENQINLMKRLTKNWTIMYDGDTAGYDAMIKSLPKMLELGLNVSFVQLPEGDDADTLIFRLGTEKFKQWMGKNKKPLDQFIIDQTLNDFEYKLSKMQEEVVDKLNVITNVLNGTKKDIVNSMIRRRLGI